MPAPRQLVALRRDVFAVTLDPLTHSEIGECRLEAGTLVEQPDDAVRDAEARAMEMVTVRVRDPRGWTGIARVGLLELRDALSPLA
jgi:hypothetical protein